MPVVWRSETPAVRRSAAPVVRGRRRGTVHLLVCLRHDGRRPSARVAAAEVMLIGVRDNGGGFPAVERRLYCCFVVKHLVGAIVAL